MAEKKHITCSGKRKLESELADLKVNQRSRIAAKIKEAREQGDITENAEYDAAKDEQRDIEARIEEIEAFLRTAEVVVDADVDLSRIGIGCQVKVFDIDYDEETEFTIVGSTEVDSLRGRISDESPIGSALLGHKVGDTVRINTQAGTAAFRVLGISHAMEVC